ncbi:hypothetical protein G7Y89_g297 [Cudoniella acicularis]|uniref:Peroxidase n=1 Tax=Cudoniella acicularis TaxID=354080 RepID=A0A8H4RYA3_9HELO|nr:hypothetical protein G7Y89_g297 [Cudoniella acicularis]
MLFPILLTLASLSQGLNAQAVDAFGITQYEKIEAIERQILNPFTLVSVVSPCSVNFDDDPARGEQTSAEWVRIVFHDMITANAAGPGLGGLDASIGFEFNRPENIGIFINVTLGQFSQFFSPFLSMADLIGVGIADALATCDPTSRRLPLRVGRMDAAGPGPSGVPKPTDGFAVAKAAFAQAGFSQSEMIQAVACGHSLGGVHQSNFPDIADGDQPLVGTDGRESFDSTPAVFDNVGVNEYLNGTGLQGGPLVIGPNATNSDLRIFSSDGNLTIKAMSSPQSFENTCFTIFEKMINTVPAAVTLSDPIGPRPWILRESHLDLNSAGLVTFSGTITGHSASPLPVNASYFYGTVGGGNTGPKLSQGGVPYPLFLNTVIGFNTITDYLFNDTLNSPNINTINVQSSYQAPINQNIFILPSQSFIDDIRNSDGVGFVQINYVVRVAILKTLAPTTASPTAKIWYAIVQAGSVAPGLAVKTSGPMTFKTTIGAYNIFQVVLTIGDGVNNLGAGEQVLQVNLGSTLSSAKKWGENQANETTHAAPSENQAWLVDCINERGVNHSEIALYPGWPNGYPSFTVLVRTKDNSTAAWGYSQIKEMLSDGDAFSVSDMALPFVQNGFKVPAKLGQNDCADPDFTKDVNIRQQADDMMPAQHTMIRSTSASSNTAGGTSITFLAYSDTVVLDGTLSNADIFSGIWNQRNDLYFLGDKMNFRPCIPFD